MNEIHFNWDDSKAESNLIKHKVSFSEATSVFDDDNARLVFDSDHSHKEERFILLGISYKLRILVVVHCTKEDENNIRIIFARKATKHEQKQYKGYLR